MKNFNGLTPSEAERLALLLEELGEAQQAIGKILRHGYDSRHPNGGPNNKQNLEKELGDVMAAMDLLCGEHEEIPDLSNNSIQAARFNKHESCKQYMHHQNFE